MSARAPGGTPGVAFSAVLMLATTSGFFSLFAISVLGPFVIPDLDLSRAAFGALSTALYLSASASSLVAGRIVDTLSSRSALLVLFGAAAAAWVTMASSGSWAGLLLGGVIAGLPMALALPITTGLVRAGVPRGRRGGYLGIAQAGSQVGGLVAGATLPSLAVQFGWRLSLAGSTVLAALGAGLASRTFSGTVRSVPSTARVALDVDVVLWLSLYGFVMNAGATVTTAYLPIYAYESLGLSAAGAGSVAVVVASIAIVAKVVWGRVTDAARLVPLPLLALAGLSFVAALLLAAATEQRVWLLWSGVVLFSLGVVSWSVLTMTAVARLVVLEALGRTSGMIMLASFMGAALAPVGFGWLVDRQGGYRGAWLATAGLYVVASLAISGWLLRRRVSNPGLEPRGGVDPAD